MKKRKFISLLVLLMLLLNACDDKASKGNPKISDEKLPTSANFGDSIPFSAFVTDEVSLSTLKAQLYYGVTMVSETVVRTKENGSYSGKLFVPFMKNVPEGDALLKLVLQNVELSLNTVEKSLPVTIYDYPKLVLKTEENKTYDMLRDEKNVYRVTDKFPSKMNALIIAPKSTEQGNEVIFGWENNEIVIQGQNYIQFSDFNPEGYEVTFNLASLEASPFGVLSFADVEMTSLDGKNYTIEKKFEQGEKINVGLANFDDWFFDPDYFKKEENGKLSFLAYTGKYRIIANNKDNAVLAERMQGDKLSTLADGGSLWIIGWGIGKPSPVENNINWNPDKALCLSQIGEKEFQITLTVAPGYDFKIFHQKGWGGEFKRSDYASHSDELVTLTESGNFKALNPDKLDPKKQYLLKIDLSDGNDKLKMQLKEKGT